MNSIFHRKTLIIGAVLFSLGAFALVANATHSWGGYHWARTSNPFTLKLGNNTSGTWTGLLNTVSSDWSASTLLDTSVIASGKNPKTCRPTLGRDEICNANYGNTGWLGVASVWIYSDGHIAQGTVKNNDYYFGSSTYPYNNEAEKLHVICQEIGHTLGLDHQSTDGFSLDTCMDYYHNTSDSDTRSTLPNAHDYEELGIIYGGHTDVSNSYTTASASNRGFSGLAQSGDFEKASEWGKSLKQDNHGRDSLFERDLGKGNKIFTFVIWAD